MNLTYISASFIPSQNANSVHVMKMCRSFARAGHDVTLFAQLGHQENVRDIYGFYGIDPVFRLEQTERVPLKFFWNMFYARSVCNMLKQDLPEIVYGRHVYALALAAQRFKNIKIGYEAHALPLNMVQKKLEAGLFKQKNFKRLITITEALKQDYLAAFPFLSAAQISVAPDGADPHDNTAPAHDLPGSKDAFRHAMPDGSSKAREQAS